MADIACPQCGTVTEIEEGEYSFCSNCDYPLFWAGKDEDRDAEKQAVAKAEIDAEVAATDVICRTCAERNPGTRTFCLRCGAELLAPVAEPFNPEEPPLIAEFPPPRANETRILAAVVAVIAIGALAVGGFFGWQRFQERVQPVLIHTLDTGDTGYNAAVHFGEGAPVIAYRSADKVLHYIRCEKTDCTGKLTKVALIRQGDPGHDTSIDLVGPPMILYRDAAAKAMRAVRCGTFNCDNAEGNRRFNQIDPDDAGYASTMAVGGGIAIASYRDGSGNLKVAFFCTDKCADDDGRILDRGSDNGRVITTISGGLKPGTVGRDSSIAIPLGATPYVVYRDEVVKAVQLIHCTNRSCSKNDPPVALATGILAADVSMMIGRDGFPIVAFRDQDKSQVVVIACGDIVCGPETRTQTVVDDGGEKSEKVGFFLQIAPGKDSNPVLAYRDESNGSVKLALCGDQSCSREKRTFQVVEGGAGTDLGHDLSARSAGGFLYLAYRDAGAKTLKFARIRL